MEQRTWRTGILVYLHGYAPEKTIGWRTDIDALPVEEETGLPLNLLMRVVCMPVVTIFI